MSYDLVPFPWGSKIDFPITTAQLSCSEPYHLDYQFDNTPNIWIIEGRLKPIGQKYSLLKDGTLEPELVIAIPKSGNSYNERISILKNINYNDPFYILPVSSKVFPRDEKFFTDSCNYASVHYYWLFPGNF